MKRRRRMKRIRRRIRTLERMKRRRIMRRMRGMRGMRMRMRALTPVGLERDSVLPIGTLKVECGPSSFFPDPKELLEASVDKDVVVVG
jgi:hypothetical protein